MFKDVRGALGILDRCLECDGKGLKGIISMTIEEDGTTGMHKLEGGEGTQFRDGCDVLEDPI